MYQGCSLDAKPPVLFVALGVVEQEEDGKGDGSVDRGTDEFVEPEDVEVDVPQEAAIDEKDQEAVEEEEAEVDDNAGREVLDVDLNADAGGYVADDRLRHADDADGLSSEGVLKEANGGSCERASYRVAAGDGEEDSDDERKIENGETGKGSRKKSLQKDGRQRHQDRNGWGEAVLLEFSTGCVATGGH